MQHQYVKISIYKSKLAEGNLLTLSMRSATENPGYRGLTVCCSSYSVSRLVENDIYQIKVIYERSLNMQMKCCEKKYLLVCQGQRIIALAAGPRKPLQLS